MKSDHCDNTNSNSNSNPSRWSTLGSSSNGADSTPRRFCFWNL